MLFGRMGTIHNIKTKISTMFKKITEGKAYLLPKRNVFVVVQALN